MENSQNPSVYDELRVLTSVESVSLMDSICEETLRRILVTPFICRNSLMNLLLKLNIQVATLILSLLDLILSSDLRSLLGESHFVDLQKVIWILRFIFNDANDYRLFTNEHRQDITQLVWYMNRISSIQGVNSLKPHIDGIVDELILLTNESIESLSELSDRRDYSLYEMGWIAGTTVDVICSMGLMLTSVSEVFMKCSPVYSLLLEKWMGNLYDMVLMYSSFPDLGERDSELRSEKTWKSTIHITRKCVDEVMWYEEVDEYKEIVLECLDRLTIVTYDILDRN